MSAKFLRNLTLFSAIILSACAYTTPEEFAQRKISETRKYEVPFENLYACFVETSMLTNTQNYLTDKEGYVGGGDSLKIIFRPTGTVSSSVEFAHMPCCGLGIRKLKKIVDQCAESQK